MIKLGSNNIGAIYLGTNSIGKAYLGSNLVFQKDSTPRPIFHTRLVFDGTAYIDTDVVIPEDGSIRFPCGYETQEKYQVMFSADGKVGMYMNNSTNTTTRYINAVYDGTTVISGTTLSLAWSYNAYGLFLTPKRGGIGTTAFSFTKGSSRPTKGITIGQNGAHTGTPYTGAVNGWIRIYGSDAQNATSYSDLDNYTPIATLRPCTYLGEAGLWCVQTSTFYGNTAGAGQLSVAD